MAFFYPFPAGIETSELREFGTRMRETLSPSNLTPEVIVAAAGGRIVRRNFNRDADGIVILVRLMDDVPFELTLPDRPVHGDSFLAARAVGHARLHHSPLFRHFDPKAEVHVPLYPNPDEIGTGPGASDLCLEIVAAIEEAHDFAFGFLMPEPAFRRAWGGIRHIPAAAAALGVSQLDVAIYAIRLGLAAEDDPDLHPFLDASEETS